MADAAGDRVAADAAGDRAVADAGVPMEAGAAATVAASAAAAAAAAAAAHSCCAAESQPAAQDEAGVQNRGEASAQPSAGSLDRQLGGGRMLQCSFPHDARCRLQEVRATLECTLL